MRGYAYLVAMFESFKLADLGLSKQDVTNFKEFIGQQAHKYKKSNDSYLDIHNFYLFPGEKVDFGFYKSVADSLGKLSEKVVGNVFLKKARASGTAHYWRGIQFEFKDGTVLSVSSTGEYPGYFYLPWRVRYNGDLVFKSNSLKFSKMLHKLTKGAFFLNDVQDKKYAIFQIANALYKEKLFGRHK